MTRRKWPAPDPPKPRPCPPCDCTEATRKSVRDDAEFLQHYARQIRIDANVEAYLTLHERADIVVALRRAALRFDDAAAVRDAIELVSTELAADVEWLNDPDNRSAAPAPVRRMLAARVALAFRLLASL